MLPEGSREIDALGGVPSAGFSEAVGREFDYVEDEVGAETLVVEFYDVG